MGRASYHNTVLEAGLAALVSNGYNATGVQDIVNRAGVPKGSFYNHFESKEALGIAALDLYWERAEEARAILLNKSLPVLDRIDRHLALAGSPEQGCLIGNLAAELASQRPFRNHLESLWDLWMTTVAECLLEGQGDGSVQQKFCAADLARFVLSQWEGALLACRMESDPSVLTKAREMIREFIRA